MNVEHMQRAYAPDKHRATFRGSRAIEARWARESIADGYAWDRALRAWAVEFGLDPFRRGIAWEADSSRLWGMIGRDDAESVRVDHLYILDGATNAEADAIYSAWSRSGAEYLWRDRVLVAS